MSKRYRSKLVVKLFPSVPKGVFGGGRLTAFLEERVFYREFRFGAWKLAALAVAVGLLVAWSITSLGLSWHALGRAEALRAEVVEREAQLTDAQREVAVRERDYYLLLSRLTPLNEKVDELAAFSQKMAMVAGVDALAEELGSPIEDRELSLTLSEGEAEALVERFRRLELITADREFELARTPSISPLKTDFVPTDRFGYRPRKVGQGVGGKNRQFHAGLDLAAPTGTPIFAPADATVHFAGRVPRRQSPRVALYGNFMVLDHGNGIRTVHAHCDRLNVKTGDEIKRGEVIGWVGSTGRSTGPHLHYEVVVHGRPVDPELFILDVAIPRRRMHVDFDSPSPLLEEVDKLLGL